MSQKKHQQRPFCVLLLSIIIDSKLERGGEECDVPRWFNLTQTFPIFFNPNRYWVLSSVRMGLRCALGAGEGVGGVRPVEVQRGRHLRLPSDNCLSIKIPISPLSGFRRTPNNVLSKIGYGGRLCQRLINKPKSWYNSILFLQIDVLSPVKGTGVLGNKRQNWRIRKHTEAREKEHRQTKINGVCMTEKSVVMEGLLWFAHRKKIRPLTVSNCLTLVRRPLPPISTCRQAHGKELKKKINLCHIYLFLSFQLFDIATHLHSG